MKEPEVQKKDHIKAAAGTILSIGVLFVGLFLLGLSYQNPPPEEQGVEVNLGDSDLGFGDNPEPEPTENPAPRPTTPPKPTSVSENISTQSTQQSVAINKKENKKEEKPTKVDPTPEQTKEPEINQKALFPGTKKTNQSGGSEGKTYGPGNQGKAGGDPNSNRYDGTPGKGGTGWSLKGRTAKALPEPSYNSNQQGKVIVKIWVDRNGNVTRAEAQANSTITDSGLKKQAENAAMKSKFSPDPNATELQTGTITYDFRKFN
ncbi:MAG: TonB family protein [Bacteroidales bacterium]|nr:TonB family protein [Bacteroidales bacterium]